MWPVVAAVTLAGCGSDVSITEKDIAPVVIIDQGGKHWDITQAVYRYGFAAGGFQFGFGAEVIRPLILPPMLAAGDSLFPPRDSSFVVLGTVLDGQPRAYGEQSVIPFEVVNDFAATRALAVVVQPADLSARGYLRTTAGRTLTLSASGWLYDYRTVLYDRETESMWYRLDGETRLTCINGEFLGNTLSPVPVTRSGWTGWLDAHPQTRVLRLPSAPVDSHRP